MSRSYRTAVSVFVAFVAVLALAAPSSAAPAKTPKAHSVVGTLQKIDGQNITVQTAKGPETVMLMSTSRILRGATTIQATNLSSYTGQRIKVRYVDQNGEKQAQTVTLASAPKVAASSKPASTPATKSSKK